MATSNDCLTCGKMWENNQTGEECPACGSTSVSSYYDEPYTDEAEDDEVADIRQAIYENLRLETY